MPGLALQPTLHFLVADHEDSDPTGSKLRRFLRIVDPAHLLGYIWPAQKVSRRKLAGYR
jgi:hypothetical protein